MTAYVLLMLLCNAPGDCSADKPVPYPSMAACIKVATQELEEFGFLYRYSTGFACTATKLEKAR